MSKNFVQECFLLRLARDTDDVTLRQTYAGTAWPILKWGG